MGEGELIGFAWVMNRMKGGNEVSQLRGGVQGAGHGISGVGEPVPRRMSPQPGPSAVEEMGKANAVTQLGEDTNEEGEEDWKAALAISRRRFEGQRFRGYQGRGVYY
jgi:hypothetical protein